MVRYNDFFSGVKVTIEGWSCEDEDEGISDAVMGPQQVAILTTSGSVLMVPVIATEHCYSKNEDEKGGEEKAQDLGEEVLVNWSACDACTDTSPPRRGCSRRSRHDWRRPSAERMRCYPEIPHPDPN